MGWESILTMIIAIISMILEYLGGGTFPNPLQPNQDTVYHLASYQWACDDPYWASGPTIVNRHFEGRLEMDCRVEGVSGGGIIELRKHMIDQLPTIADQIHEGPTVENFEGLPSTVYDMSLAMEAGDDVSQMRGNTHIATNGFTVLKNTFVSSVPPESGNAAYVRNVRNSIEVTKSEEGWYGVKLVYQSRVRKPFLLSPQSFLNSMKTKNEQQMEDRKERILNDVASHL